MNDKTGIEWTDATWNPVTGCTKVSQGCKHCYAERDWQRLQHLPRFAGREFSDVDFHPGRLDQPLRWAKQRRIFVNSMSDLFHEEVPTGFIDQVFAVMALCPQHTFQVLTKRTLRMRDYVSEGGRAADVLDIVRNWEIGYRAGGDKLQAQAWPLPNVWLGVSVEDQATADQRIPILLQTPAAVRWISAEPLLGPIDLDRLAIDSCDDDYTISALSGRRIARYGTKPGAPRLDWVVVGSESGTKARPCDIEWVRDLKNQCEIARVPFFFKQLVDGRGRKIHTPELDGRIWTDYPSAA